MQLGEPFLQVAAILLVAAVAGAAGLLLRQPLILSFLAVGILVGPSALDLVRSPELVELLGELGIALLLFVVGLRLDPRELRHLGAVAVGAGLGQIAFTAGVGYLLALALGFSPLVALYVAVALTFSSTIIVVKLLADRRELDTLHGRAAIGCLVVQDLFVILVLAVLSLLGGGERPTLGDLGGLALAGVAFAAGVYLLVRLVLSRLLKALARSKELLVLVAVAWAVALAATAEILGFSHELGAFIAGVALAASPFRDAIGSRLVTLRDFLLLFFFVHLGQDLDLSLLGAQALAAGVLSLFVLVGKPLIVLAIMGAMGYRSRTGFLAGVTLAQISEFSFLLMAMGAALGHVGPDAIGLVTLVGLVTIAGSTQMIQRSRALHERLGRPLRVFERRRTPREDREPEGKAPVDAIVYGLGRYGLELARAFEANGWKVLALDIDPDAVRRAQHAGLDARFGDAEDPEFPGELPLHGVRCVVCTVPEPRIARTLVGALEHHGFRGTRAVTAHTQEALPLLEEAGADRVLTPFADAATRAARDIVEEADE